jgi:hypothetical protein
MKLNKKMGRLKKGSEFVPVFFEIPSKAQSLFYPQALSIVSLKNGHKMVT